MQSFQTNIHKFNSCVMSIDFIKKIKAYIFFQITFLNHMLNTNQSTKVLKKICKALWSVEGAAGLQLKKTMQTYHYMLVH